MKHLHKINVWGAVWQHSRSILMRIWSRTNLEHRNVRWTAKKVLPSIVVKGQITRGDRSTWTCEANALEEAELWKIY